MANKLNFEQELKAAKIDIAFTPEIKKKIRRSVEFKNLLCYIVS